MSIARREKKLSKGNKSTWPDDYHFLMVQLMREWDQTSNDDIDTVKLCLMGDPSAVRDGTCYTKDEFKKLQKGDSLHIADREIYATLNGMFEHTSPAYAVIKHGVSSKKINRGEGVKLFAALHLHFTKGNYKSLDITSLCNRLQNIKVTKGEYGPDYLLRFDALYAQLLFKEPPVNIADPLLMSMLSKGLNKDYSKVQEKQERGEFGVKYQDLRDAIEAESDIILARGSIENDEEVVVLASESSSAEDEKKAKKKAKRERAKEKKKAKKEEAKKAEEEKALAAASNDDANPKGKGKGKGKQCHICGSTSHLRGNCPQNIWGQNQQQMIFCRFHNSWGWHSEAQCFRNPNNPNALAKGKGKGRGANYPANYGSPYGRGAGFVAQRGTTFLNPLSNDDSDDSLYHY